LAGRAPVETGTVEATGVAEATDAAALAEGADSAEAIAGAADSTEATEDGWALASSADDGADGRGDEPVAGS